MSSSTTTQAGVARRRTKRIPLTYVVALVPVAVALNIVGGQINSILHLPRAADRLPRFDLRDKTTVR